MAMTLWCPSPWIRFSCLLFLCVHITSIKTVYRMNYWTDLIRHFRSWLSLLKQKVSESGAPSFSLPSLPSTRAFVCQPQPCRGHGVGHWIGSNACPPRKFQCWTVMFYSYSSFCPSTFFLGVIQLKFLMEKCFWGSLRFFAVRKQSSLNNSTIHGGQYRAIRKYDYTLANKTYMFVNFLDGNNWPKSHLIQQFMICFQEQINTFKSHRKELYRLQFME